MKTTYVLFKGTLKDGRTQVIFLRKEDWEKDGELPENLATAFDGVIGAQLIPGVEVTMECDNPLFLYDSMISLG